VNLQTGSASGGDAQDDTLSGIEKVIGSAFTDVLTGGGGNDTIVGGGGNDTLDGGAGIDTAVYAGTLAQSALTRVSGHWEVTPVPKAPMPSSTPRSFGTAVADICSWAMAASST